jgi:hypothetical protein
MARALPPSPSEFRSLNEWATELYEFFLAQTRAGEDNDPLPVLLPHRTQGVMERAAVNGILLFDPDYDTPVVSETGAWEPLRNTPQFAISYDTAATTDGATITTGGAKVPFDTAEVEVAPWATFNSGTTDFTLSRGKYYIEGFVSLTKVSGGEKSFAGYLAESSDLTTPVGTVRMGTLIIPTNGANEATHVVPFRGQVTVPEGGETYAMVVNTPDSDTRFGSAHDITGYQNIFARLAITLIGLNE